MQILGLQMMVSSVRRSIAKGLLYNLQIGSCWLNWIIKDFNWMVQPLLGTLATTLVGMLRPRMEAHILINVGVLSVSDKLLHYMFVHILCPWHSNYSQLQHKDIFMLWAIKNNISINRPHYIMQHMVKCRDNNMSLPYVMLISQFIIACEINLSLESCMNLGWCHFFGKKSMKKLNIHLVHGVW